MGIVIVQLENLSERQRGTTDESFAITPSMSRWISIWGSKWIDKGQFTNATVWTPTAMETQDDREALIQRKKGRVSTEV